MKYLISFIKKETVLCIAILLALCSAFFVHPDRAYLDYIDVRTLAILFCLMAVVAGLGGIGLFDWLAGWLLSRAKKVWQVLMLLVMLCFWFGMLITNDVALVTFVPFAMIVLKQIKCEHLLVPVVVLQTIAANLGSMVTPVGNPQNLYLYGLAGFGVGAFVRLMLPYAGLALFLLIICVAMVALRENRRHPKGGTLADKGVAVSAEESRIASRGKLLAYLALFVVCLLSVVRLISWEAVLELVIIACLVMDKKVLLRVDYSLLGTFVGFFVFVGNLGRVDAFRDFLAKMIEGREVLTAILSSQLMSNVPAALLLSGFTERIDRLIIGVNLGGLGTLIASMASLISYKYVARRDAAKRGGYMLCFSLLGLVFLAFELVLYACIG